MPNPYTQIATDLTTESAAILLAFNNAETELVAQSAPQVGYLELEWNGSNINRLSDGSQVSGLPPAEQKRLYPQLGGLFNFAMSKLLYP